MTGRERLRKAVKFEKTDRVPTGFECVSGVEKRLLKEKNLKNYSELLDFYNIDIADCSPKYIGKRTGRRVEDGKVFVQSIYGGELWKKNNHGEIHSVMYHYPFNEETTVKDILNYDWITPDDFDYDEVKRKCDANPDRALIFGHEGPFQLSTFMMEMGVLFEKMVLEPDTAKTLFDRFVQFELEHYERILIAAEGRADILRPHDDYGTQQGLLFSTDMYRQFFYENTKKLCALAHRYNAFYQQHSCGAVHDLIPLFIECGVDILEPLQKVKGLESEVLANEFFGKIAFHGGVDTQGVLPFGSPEEVKQQAKELVHQLGRNGGYILMSSQALEVDVPTENIDALFAMENREL